MESNNRNSLAKKSSAGENKPKQKALDPINETTPSTKLGTFKHAAQALLASNDFPSTNRPDSKSELEKQLTKSLLKTKFLKPRTAESRKGSSISALSDDKSQFSPDLKGSAANTIDPDRENTTLCDVSAGQLPNCSIKPAADQDPTWEEPERQADVTTRTKHVETEPQYTAGRDLPDVQPEKTFAQALPLPPSPPVCAAPEPPTAPALESVDFAQLHGERIDLGSSQQQRGTQTEREDEQPQQQPMLVTAVWSFDLASSRHAQPQTQTLSSVQTAPEPTDVSCAETHQPPPAVEPTSGLVEGLRAVDGILALVTQSLAACEGGPELDSLLYRFAARTRQDFRSWQLLTWNGSQEWSWAAPITTGFYGDQLTEYQEFLKDSDSQDILDSLSISLEQLHGLSQNYFPHGYTESQKINFLEDSEAISNCSTAETYQNLFLLGESMPRIKCHPNSASKGFRRHETNSKSPNTNRFELQWKNFESLVEIYSSEIGAKLDKLTLRDHISNLLSIRGAFLAATLDFEHILDLVLCGSYGDLHDIYAKLFQSNEKTANFSNLETDIREILQHILHVKTLPAFETTKNAWILALRRDEQLKMNVSDPSMLEATRSLQQKVVCVTEKLVPTKRVYVLL